MRILHKYNYAYIFISVCLHFYNCISLFTKLGYTKLSMTLTIKRISHTPFMSVVCFTSFFLNGSIIFHRKHTPSFFHPVPYCCIFMFSSFFFFFISIPFLLCSCGSTFLGWEPRSGVADDGFCLKVIFNVFPSTVLYDALHILGT